MNKDGSISQQSDFLEYKEVDFEKDSLDAEIFKTRYSGGIRGIFTVSDFSKLRASSNYELGNYLPSITFIPCHENQAQECAEPSEIEEFLKTN